MINSLHAEITSRHVLMREIEEKQIQMRINEYKLGWMNKNVHTGNIFICIIIQNNKAYQVPIPFFNTQPCGVADWKYWARETLRNIPPAHFWKGGGEGDIPYSLRYICPNTALAVACILLPLLLLDKDLLKLCERLVPRLGQDCQGKGCSKQEGAWVEEEYALRPDQAGQVGECLKRALVWNGQTWI